MAAYISHAIMGNELYENLTSDSNILKTEISGNELRGYSLGADLASLSKNTSCDPHNYHTQAFFLSMVNYIKNNKLIENNHIIALLYGHMAHYFFDINVHPLVYYIECGCQKVGMIPNHNLVEGYYDSYLAEKVMNCDIMKIHHNFFSQIDLEINEVKKLLNNVYGQVYNDYNIIKTYKKVIGILTLLEKIIKSGVVPKEFLIKISQFKEFLEVNNLSYHELTNYNNEIYTNPVTNEKHNESLMQLYNKSIDMCIEAIKDVNNYLYCDKSLSSLERTFTDLSYDTGVSCSLGKKLIYVRKR